MTQIVLAFVPLVESNFGQIYPSTAVLAAYLEPRGHRVIQLDWNARFFGHLVSDEELAAAGDGAYHRSRTETVAAARWVRRRLDDGSLQRADLVSADRTHPLHSILRLLAAPYSVDPDHDMLCGTSGDPNLDASYDRFFSSVLDELGQRLDHERPSTRSPEGVILGASVPMGPQLVPALRFASIWSASRPDQQERIVFGGPALSLLHDTELVHLLQRNPAVDCLVRFDGEGPLAALADQLGVGSWSPESVPGVVSLVRHQPHSPAPAPGPVLDSLATPAYSVGQVVGAPRARLGVLQARGCYWGRCDYCDFVEVYQGSPPYRGRKAERVVEDIRRLVERTGIRRFRIITEAIPPAFARRFSELLCQSELPVRWSSFIMVDERFDRDLLTLMAESGCDLLVVGLESMVTRALELVHKSADREQNLRFLQAAHEATIPLYVNVIPDLPSTTRLEALAGLRDLENVADCLTEVTIIPFETTQSSRVGRAPHDFGLVPTGDTYRAAQAELAVNTLPVSDPAMTAIERAEVFQAYRDFAARTNRRKVRPVPRPLMHYTELVRDEEGLSLFDFTTMERLDLHSGL